MITSIKKAFIDNLPNLEWMDNKTRTAAIGKVSVKCNVSALLSQTTCQLEIMFVMSSANARSLCVVYFVS